MSFAKYILVATCLLPCGSALRMTKWNTKTDEPLWPSKPQVEQLRSKMHSWVTQYGQQRRARNECYSGCCGFGHRNVRTSSQSTHAWSHRQPIQVSWGKCEESGSWIEQDKFGFLFGRATTEFPEFFAELNSSECASNIGNEPVWDHGEEDIGEMRTKFQAGIQVEKGFHPGVSLYHAMLQYSIRTDLRDSIQEFVQEEFRSNKNSGPVVGVHLRLGNGEEAALEDKRTITDKNADEICDYIGLVAKAAVRDTLGHSGDFRIFIATDQRSFAQSCSQRDARVFFNAKAFALPDNQGVNIATKGADCKRGEEAVLTDMSLLGHTDILLLPQFSTATTLPKTMIRNRGKTICENTQWLERTGTLPDEHLPLGIKTAKMMDLKQATSHELLAKLGFVCHEVEKV